jgi:CxxC motif-containing protein (DUF1111 family)
MHRAPPLNVYFCFWGLGMAQVFSRAGMRVVIADIRQDAIDVAMRQFPPATPACSACNGTELADETVSGVRVKSLWRTAPLWGLGYRVKEESYPTFLHDGRATSIEEAILWHSGEAAYSKYKFMKLGPRAREALLRWLATL